MKTPIKPTVVVSSGPSEQDISDYAFHLYQQNHCEHGHDLEHWREATACLVANKSRRAAMP